MSRIDVNGDKNQVYSNIKGSSINSHEQKGNHYANARWVGLASLGVAVLGLIVACIANWDKIIDFFK